MKPVQEQVDAYNARDLERFLACYATDVVIENAAGDRLVAGEAAMREMYGALFANSPSLSAEVRSQFTTGEFTVLEEYCSGMNLPGYPTELHIGVVYRVRAGKIDHVRFLM
ncbi:nuclear transport factor 2 family protein [Gemmatimonas groenlandica]|uniref:Nuclear transport factor 2 family protein n=1 Tax=Gemmatimonas groenlandica TaxID=2732249 RepID=A0A6M4IW29_9BACT|nr:nuclear transport factor 2 family protein [Gemmatimonas groenlandica]QJR37919.1 nuclear transport factor 2 family protein [Gemmatimonas groenlandica]